MTAEKVARSALQSSFYRNLVQYSSDAKASIHAQDPVTEIINVRRSNTLRLLTEQAHCHMFFRLKRQRI